MGAHYTFTEEERPPKGAWPAPAKEKEAGPRWEAAASVVDGCGGDRRWKRVGADGGDGGDRSSGVVGRGRGNG